MNANRADLKGAVQQWADRIGVKVREIHLRSMQRKWASISTKGRLTLNMGVGMKVCRSAQSTGSVNRIRDCP